MESSHGKFIGHDLEVHIPAPIGSIVDIAYQCPNMDRIVLRHKSEVGV